MVNGVRSTVYGLHKPDHSHHDSHTYAAAHGGSASEAESETVAVLVWYWGGYRCLPPLPPETSPPTLNVSAAPAVPFSYVARRSLTAHKKSAPTPHVRQIPYTQPVYPALAGGWGGHHRTGLAVF